MVLPQRFDTMPPLPPSPYRLILLLLLFGGGSIGAQPPVCRSLDQLDQVIRHDPSMALVELRSVAPTLQVELRYAGKNNFVGKRMYPAKTRSTFLRRDPAQALGRVQEELRGQGLGLKIWDAYRPYSVSVAFWKLIGDERYVANPARGSGHNRGIAIDLTLVKWESSEELDMGTGFDHFSDTAHHSFRQLPDEVLQNRMKLRAVMEKNGFRSYEEEWWHYSWPMPTRFDLLDIPFSKLKKRFN